MKRILIVIVTFNALKWIDKCLSSISSQSTYIDIYIVDNRSSDGTSEYIKRYYPEVIFYQSISNLGFGKANNIGLNYALRNNYDYVYLLNQDAWLLPNTIEELINIHVIYPEYGILSPIQVQANMKHLDQKFANRVCGYASNEDLLSDLYFGQRKSVYSVPFVMAAHWLISKECLLKVGGFSNTFPHYGEDNNFIDRAIFHGFKIGIVPNAIAVHDRENRIDTFEQMIYMEYINTLIQLSNINDLPKHPLLHTILSTIKSIIHFKSFKPLSYLFEILSNWEQIKFNTKYSRHYTPFLNIIKK